MVGTHLAYCHGIFAVEIQSFQISQGVQAIRIDRADQQNAWIGVHFVQQ